MCWASWFWDGSTFPPLGEFFTCGITASLYGSELGFDVIKAMVSVEAVCVYGRCESCLDHCDSDVSCDLVWTGECIVCSPVYALCDGGCATSVGLSTGVPRLVSVLSEAWFEVSPSSVLLSVTFGHVLLPVVVEALIVAAYGRDDESTFVIGATDRVVWCCVMSYSAFDSYCSLDYADTAVCRPDEPSLWWLVRVVVGLWFA